MKVKVGSSLAAYVSDRGCVPAQDKVVPAQDKVVPASLFLAGESGHGGAQIGLRVSSKSLVDSSEDSSSSIGESSENEHEEEDDVVSFHGEGGFDSFSSSLEDSLPIKRGLSNHYVGKSKSFGNLMEVRKGNARDLEKGENPLNKRRRLVIANKLRGGGGRSLSVSNFYSWQNPNSMPLLAFQEHNEDQDEDDQTMKLLEMMMKSKRDLVAQTHQSCFCLSSLQEEDDDCDDE
ncbi:hypothetical protein AALP_AA6G270900 [Arabis alpina]|uniref:Uncharacterized protein n=1 Tax=Arabis alpina TaxID=50452 RepID=A0A087GS00_ARAAL|nr:hypothetical protein AALP_AA6G270900 [Arabis alpina]